MYGNNRSDYSNDDRNNPTTSQKKNPEKMCLTCKSKEYLTIR